MKLLRTKKLSLFDLHCPKQINKKGKKEKRKKKQNQLLHAPKLARIKAQTRETRFDQKKQKKKHVFNFLKALFFSLNLTDYFKIYPIKLDYNKIVQSNSI